MNSEGLNKGDDVGGREGEINAFDIYLECTAQTKVGILLSPNLQSWSEIE